MIDDGCPSGPEVAGTFSEADFKIGTGSLDPCGNNAWPLDLVSTGISANKFDIVDLASFVSGLRKLNTNPGETGFNMRWDIAPGDSGFGKFINAGDLAISMGGLSGFPPMLDGVKAMGKRCPFAP